jgi:hypothetical protein
MTVFVYVDTSKQVGDPEHVKVFAKHGRRGKMVRGKRPRGRCLRVSSSRMNRNDLVPELTAVANIKLNARVSLLPITTSIAELEVAQVVHWHPSTARSGVASSPRGGPAH